MKKLLLCILALFITQEILAQPSRRILGNHLISTHDIQPSTSGDSMWIATNMGVYLQTDNLQNTQIFFPDFKAYCIHKSGNNLWFGGENRILMFDGTSWDTITGSGLPPNYIVRDIVVNDGTPWFIINDTLYSYTNGVFNSTNIEAAKLVRGNNRFAVIINPGRPNQVVDTVSMLEYRNGRFDSLPVPSAFVNSPVQTQRARDAVYINNTLYMLMHVGRKNIINRYSRFSRSWTSTANPPNIPINQNGYHILAEAQNRLFAFTRNCVVEEIDLQTLTPISTQHTELRFIQNTGVLRYKSIQDRISLVVEYATSPQWLPNTLYYAIEWSVTAADKPIQEVLDLNDFTFPVIANGLLGFGFTNIINDEIKLGDINMIFSAAPWFTGEINDTAFVEANRYNSFESSSFLPGPVADFIDPSYLQRYSRVWKISQNEIDIHKTNFSDSAYIMPEVIANWPGNGRHLNGEAFQLAPFIDVNSNGIYEPELGDYPKILGHQAVYAIFRNANEVERNRFNIIPKSNLELHMMVYAFDSAGLPDLNSTVFINYRIFNRGTETMKSAKFALNNDFTLGAGTSQCLGSDHTENIIFGYSCNTTQTDPKAITIKLLNQPLEGHQHYFNQSTSGNPSLRDPQSTDDYIRYMNYAWPLHDSLRLTSPSGPNNNANGVGFDNSGQSPTTKWAFNSSDNWYFPPNQAADLRNLAITNLGDIEPGKHRCLEFAYTHGYDSNDNSGNWQNALTRAKSRLAIAESVYNDLNTGCLGVVLSREEFDGQMRQLKTFPNPVRKGHILTVQSNEKIERIEIFSVTGTPLVFKSTTIEDGIEINIPENTPSGLYLVRIYRANNTVNTEKILVE
ncbi:MAG: T9SS C-terminal target domain-containing protein [Flavobacteriales bacterium]|nr:MAG: T9SS C-terminal target domain-containing protein [Flavobacteriales bacterium]